MEMVMEVRLALVGSVVVVVVVIWVEGGGGW